MKRYYNSTTKEWYTEGNSLTRRVNGALFSGVPSVELLTAINTMTTVESVKAYDFTIGYPTKPVFGHELS